MFLVEGVKLAIVAEAEAVVANAKFSSEVTVECRVTLDAENKKLEGTFPRHACGTILTEQGVLT